MTSHEPGDRTELKELRPSWGQYRGWVARPDRLILGMAGVFLAGIFVRSGLGVGAAVVLFGVVVGLGGASLSMRTSHIVLTARSVEHHSWFVRRKTISLDDDIRGLLAVYTPFLAKKSSELLVFQQGIDGPRIRLNGAYWTHEDLAEIANFAGVPITGQTYTAEGYERHAPGIMKSGERHPIIWASVGTVVLVAILVAGVIGFYIHQGKPPFDEQPPRSVAASTIATQDTVLNDVSAAIGGRWTELDADLETCEDDDQYKGWTRRAEMHIDHGEDGEDSSGLPPATSTEIVDGIRTVLADNGYETAGHIPVEDYVEIFAKPAGGSFDDDRAVEIQLSERTARIRATGNCEVPGR